MSTMAIPAVHTRMCLCRRFLVAWILLTIPWSSALQMWHSETIARKSCQWLQTDSVTTTRVRNRRISSIHETSGNGDDQDSRRPATAATSEPRVLGRKDGVYVRPSGAIERGSGFFVPGLEGSRVRVVAGLVLLVATALNHVAIHNNSNSNTNTFLEGVAVVYSLLLLLQAAVEEQLETRRSSLSPARTASSSPAPKQLYYQQQWLIPVPATDQGQAWKSRVEWASQTVLSLTPATCLGVLGPGSIVYWIGDRPAPIDGVSQGCTAALETCRASQSGRLSLPPSHAAFAMVLESQPDSSSSSSSSSLVVTPPRCVVLQRIDESSQLCWIMTSPQLLSAFTQRDLKWLGQLALSIQQSMVSN